MVTHPASSANARRVGQAVGLTQERVESPPHSRQAPPLWRQLQAVATILIAVRAGKSWSTAQNDIDPTIRTGVQALSFAVLRHLGSAQGVRDLLVKRPPPPTVDALLCSVLALAVSELRDALPDDKAASRDGLASIASKETNGTTDPNNAKHTNDSNKVNQNLHYDPHTLVNQAVEAAKRNPTTNAQAGFLNACLRRFLREKEALLSVAIQKPQARWNHPSWWVARLQKDHPKQWQTVLQANSVQAPLTLRVNTAKTTLTSYQCALAAMNLEAHRVGQYGLQLAHTSYVPSLPGYAEGWFSVQDAAAQLAAPLLLQGFVDRAQETEALPTHPTLRVLDACAAPGGKTAHLLEFAAMHRLPVQVTALDIDAARCTRIHENLQRLDLKAQVVVADAANPAAWWDEVHFDAILLDAPCTASGIVRRHPDVRWLRRETDIAQLAAQQKRLLDTLWPLLSQGGQLLYCTCSVFLAEGQNQVQAFLAHHTDATLLPSPGHLLPQNGSELGAMPDNELGGHDGFYYALLQKN